MNIVNGNKGSLIPIESFKSKEYYNVFYNWHIYHACNANITPITKYLDSYCNNYDEILAFSNKVVFENENITKIIIILEFCMEFLHAIIIKNLQKLEHQIR